MILSKLTSLLSSSLTLGPFSSETPLATREETNPTPDVKIDPLESFLDELILEELVYESVLSFTDDLPSTKFPLTYRLPKESSRALLFVIKLGDEHHLHDEITYFFTKSATVKKKEQKILELKLSVTYNSIKMVEAFGFDPYHIYNRQDFLYALERGPIRSAEKLAKSIDDTISDYHFMTPRGINDICFNGINPMLFTYLSYPNEPLPGPRSVVRCVLMPFAPWEYTSEDFDNFTSMGTFTDGPENTDVMWAHIHDICVETRCEFFILTTYENWAFGRFSHRFGEAFISDPIFDRAEVMKYLTYWILCSCCTQDTMDMDKMTRKFELKYTIKDKRANSDQERNYDIELEYSERHQESMITYFPEPTKEWNRWCKGAPDQKQDGSDKEINDDVDRGTNDVNEEAVDGVDERAGVEGSGGGETVSPQVTVEDSNRTGEGVSVGGVDVTGEAETEENTGAGVGEGVTETMEEDIIDVMDDASAEVTEKNSSGGIEKMGEDHATTGVEEDVTGKAGIGGDNSERVGLGTDIMKDMGGGADIKERCAGTRNSCQELVEGITPMDVELAQEPEPGANRRPCENDTIENINSTLTAPPSFI